MKHIMEFQDKTGHEQVEYDTSNPDEMKKVKKRVTEMLKKGYFLFGAKKGDKEFKMLTSADSLDDDKLDRFMMSQEKGIVTPPPQSG